MHHCLSLSTLLNLNIEASWPSWSNFMCSIIRVRERLHKILGQIRSNIWFSCQPKVPIHIHVTGKMLWTWQPSFLIRSSSLLVTTWRTSIKSHKFDFRPEQTICFGVTCPWVLKIFPTDIMEMKLGSKYNLLNTPANYRSKKDPVKVLGRNDFTKYALSTIIYLMQSSENG